MRLKKRKPLDVPELSGFADRVNKLDNSEIVDAMDTTLSTLCKYVPEYRRTKDFYLLNEIELAAQAIYVMAHEIEVRRENGQPSTIKSTRQVKSMRGY